MLHDNCLVCQNLYMLHHHSFTLSVDLLPQDLKFQGREILNGVVFANDCLRDKIAFRHQKEKSMLPTSDLLKFILTNYISRQTNHCWSSNAYITKAYIINQTNDYACCA